MRTRKPIRGKLLILRRKYVKCSAVKMKLLNRTGNLGLSQGRGPNRYIKNLSFCSNLWGMQWNLMGTVTRELIIFWTAEEFLMMSELKLDTMMWDVILCDWHCTLYIALTKIFHSSFHWWIAGAHGQSIFLTSLIGNSISSLHFWFSWTAF